MSFSKIFQILFIVGSTFLIFIPECLNNSWWCFSSSFSDFEDRRRVPLKSLPVLPEIHGSSFMPSSHNCFRLWEFFSPIRSISWVVSISFLRRPSCHNSSFSACSYRSPNLTGASFKYPLISSWSLRSHVSKSPQVSSFVFQFFPVNCAFATFIFNSYGGSFKISLPSLSYQFIRCFQIPPVVPSIPSQVCAISLLILSTRISSMPNPLLVINLNWWRIGMT